MTRRDRTDDSFPSARCVFCRLEASRWQPHPEISAHDFDCEACGQYRLGDTTEATLLAFGATAVAQLWLPRIAKANARGMRLSIPGGMEIPL